MEISYGIWKYNYASRDRTTFGFIGRYYKIKICFESVSNLEFVGSHDQVRCKDKTEFDCSSLSYRKVMSERERTRWAPSVCLHIYPIYRLFHSNLVTVATIYFHDVSHSFDNNKDV